MSTQERLSREDWIAAALAALTAGGPAAVAVEPLAARLGVTKGSFYWHFGGRDELLVAVLARWELESTDDLIGELHDVADPRRRLAEWAGRVLRSDKALLVALHAAADDPIVAPVLRRVTRRRVEFLAELLREAGVTPAAASRRAQLLYSADLGLYQVAGALSDERPSERELRSMAGELERAFLP